jgi:hypothetical protein
MLGTGGLVLKGYRQDRHYMKGRLRQHYTMGASTPAELLPTA